MQPRFHLSDLRIPVIQAPMAGSGINTASLAVNVSQAGGLGSIAGAYRTITQIGEDIAALRKATTAPFAVNIFAPVPTPEVPADTHAIFRVMADWHNRFGLSEPTLPAKPEEPFEQQLELLLKEAPPVVSFTFGLFPNEAVAALQKRGCFVIGTATSVDEAQMLANSGVDAICAQGFEAGGHRGSFTAQNHAVGTIALVPQMVDAVDVPVIASGGIMDGRGIVAALALGAQAVQMGTAFLVTRESGAPPSYKNRVLQAKETDSTFTSIFSGRVARGLRNDFLRNAEDHGAPLPYPWQNALTRTLRAEGVRRDDAEVLSLWAGQGVRLARAEEAAALIKRLGIEINDVVHRLQPLEAE